MSEFEDVCFQRKRDSFRKTSDAAHVAAKQFQFENERLRKALELIAEIAREALEANP